MAKGLSDDKYIETLETEVSAYLERIRELEGALSSALFAVGCERRESRINRSHALHYRDKWEETKNRESHELETQVRDLADQLRSKVALLGDMEGTIARLKREVGRLISANEGWHTRVRQMKTDSEAWEQENTKLREELKLRRHQMSQFPFCPDHRDKVHGLECRECEIERLRIAIMKLLAANEPPEEG